MQLWIAAFAEIEAGHFLEEQGHRGSAADPTTSYMIAQPVHRLMDGWVKQGGRPGQPAVLPHR